MIEIPFRAMLRNRILLTAAAALLLFPAAISLYVMPSFTALLTSQAEKSSIESAEFIARQISLREYLELGETTFAPTVEWIVADLQRELGIHRLRFFDRSGRQAYSSDGSGKGRSIGSEAVHQQLRRGHSFSMLVRSA